MAVGSRETLRAGRIVLGLLVLGVSVARLNLASAQTDLAKRRVIPLTINKGQNYTITGVQAGIQPRIKVVSNPHALVMQTAPGRIELVGADSGTWNLKVTLATGEKVVYAVTVKAAAPPQGNLAPGSAPTAIP